MGADAKREDAPVRVDRTFGARLGRRSVLGLGAGALVAFGGGALGSLLAACSEGERSADTAPAADAPADDAPDAAAPERPAPAPGEEAGGAEQGDAEAESTELVTEIPQNETLVRSLGYVNESPEPDQNCRNCFFYTPTDEERGRCQLFTRGLVKAEGWCSSWQAKTA